MITLIFVPIIYSKLFDSLYLFRGEKCFGIITKTVLSCYIFYIVKAFFITYHPRFCEVDKIYLKRQLIKIFGGYRLTSEVFWESDISIVQFKSTSTIRHPEYMSIAHTQLFPISTVERHIHLLNFKETLHLSIWR